MIVLCPLAVSAREVAWNCMHFDQPYYSTTGIINYALWINDSLFSTGFEACLIFSVVNIASDFTVTTRDLEDSLSGFVGNWLVGSKGDVACEGTTRHQGRYLNHAKIDGETGYTTYDLTGSAPQDYYLIFAVENLDDYINQVPDPRYAYGWAHIAVNDDMSLSLRGSAMSLDGSPLVVGAIPEPSAGLLALLGFSLLALRRTRLIPAHSPH